MPKAWSSVVRACPYAPLYGPASAVAAALVTGNAVLLKPPPGLTATLVAYAEALPGAGPLLQVVTGDDETADRWPVTAATGSRACSATRRAARIVSRCASAMVPTTLFRSARR